MGEEEVGWRPDNLLGKMSYRDQRWAANTMQYTLYTASIVGYGVGFYLETFFWTAMIVLGAGAFSALLTIPNWRQREEETKWLDAAKVRSYYLDLLAREEKRAAEQQSVGFLAKLRKPKPLNHGIKK